MVKFAIRNGRYSQGVFSKLAELLGWLFEAPTPFAVLRGRIISNRLYLSVLSTRYYALTPLVSIGSTQDTAASRVIIEVGYGLDATMDNDDQLDKRNYESQCISDI